MEITVQTVSHFYLSCSKHLQHGNPAAALRIHQLYATPVLLSGMGSIILNKSETDMIDAFLKKKSQNLQKLMDKTPASIVAFLGGVLPGYALLHLKQFSIFGMITRLSSESILHRHGLHVLSSSRPSAQSWFQQMRNLCLLYQLPHPLTLLQDPLTKKTFDMLIKSNIVNHWEVKLRMEAASLESAPYIKPEFMSLTLPHPIWTTCGANPFESHKAVTTSRMLSGRYLTDRLQRHWTTNKAGYCLLPTCNPESQGSLEHLLLHCPALHSVRTRMYNLCHKVSTESEELSTIITMILQSDEERLRMQLLLDCTTMPTVIQITQLLGTHTRDRLLYIGRTWCYNIHRERMNQMGLLRFR